MPETTQDKLDALVERVGKVRRWLAALAIMRIAALCLIFTSVYIGVYAWLDHRLNFGQRGRVIALILLLAGIAGLLHRLTKLLLSRVSCSGAANYIENRRSFNQQLVTAMEYHENKQEYPYSRALAEHLVLRVDKDCSGFRFDSTVKKWQGYVLGAIILFGLATAWFYIRDNYVYFSSYFARLTQPAASVEPLSSTNLRSITEDIIAEPNSEVTFTAQIEGRTPELGRLVLVKLEPDAAEGDGEAPKPEEMQVRPTTDADRTPRFEASRSFSETGRFKYRFETDSASTDWHELSICPAPEIESMTATVAMPKRPPRRTWVKPYHEQIENNTLEVVERSTVALNVQATEKLKEVAITGLDGKTITKQLNGAQQFTFHFNADRSGSVKFDLVNEQGLANDDLPDLEVVVRTDEPPKFKLICPEGDYLTTDVASVPITFEITDDFGLDSARMCLEIPGHQPTELLIPIDEAVKSKEYSHTIELEKYELTVGDSILFYAEATDIDTGSAQANRTASSEVYFIEIRPYRQNWRPRPGGGPSQGGMPPPVELLNILEYTRAILKKTWAIAGKPNPTERDRSAMDSIDNDVRYCAEQLAFIRDDSDYGFNDRQKAVLNVVLQYYKQASKHLTEYNARSAIGPEKDAYRILRKFILELELLRNPPITGQGQQPPKPDSVKLQEKPEFSEYEKERIESEIKKVQQELKKLTREQKNLQYTFENLLKQQAEETSSAQKTANDKSSTDSGQEQSQNKESSQQQGKASAGQESKGSSGSQSASSKQESAENPNASKSQSAGKGKSTSGDPKAGDEQDSAENQSASKGESAGEGKGASGDPKAGDEQASAENQSASQSESAGEGKSTSDGQAPGDQQDSTESQSASQSQSPGEGKGASDGQAHGDQQASAENQSASQSQSPGEGKGASQGQAPGDQQDSAESQSASQSQSPGKGKGASEGQAPGDQQDSAESQSASQSQSPGKGKGASEGQAPGDQQDSAESQNTSESESAGEGKNAAGSPQSESTGKGQNASGESQQEADESQGDSEGENSGKDASAQGRSGSDGESSAEAQSGEQGQHGGQRTAANAEARLRMLQARQRALQQQVAQLKRDLEQLPESPESDRGEGRTEAQRYLDEAVARMDDFLEKLAQARYQADMGHRDSEEAVELMELARRRMDLATQALDGELTLSDEEKLAQEAQKMAEQLAEDADALDESVTPQEEQDMLALLEAAKRLLETMPEPQWATIDQSKGTRSAAGLVLTMGSGLAPAEAARQLARQFWSISIDARKRRQQLSEDESSDVKFYGQENEFFENAAKFDPESVQE